jgi:O-antigen/teichoic acid export membrane protein
MKKALYKALRWSQKFFNTDMVYVFKNGAFLFFEQIFGFAISFVSAILFARFLSKESFGIYSYVLATVNLIGVLHLTGMGTSVIRSVAKNFDGSLKKAVSFKIRWGLGISTIIMGISAYYLIKGNNILSIGFLIAALTYPFYTSLQLYYSYLNGKKKFLKSAINGMIEAFLTSLIIIGTLILTGSVMHLVIAFYLGNLLVIFFLYKITISGEKPGQLWEKDTVGYGIHLSIFRGLGNVTTYLDKFLVFQFLGAAPLATYYFAITLPNKINSLLNIVPNLALPKMVQHDFDTQRKTIIKKIFLLFLATLAITSVYIAVSPYIYQFFFPKYLDSIAYSQIFALTLLFSPFSLLFTFFQAHALKKEIYSYRIFGSLIQIISLVAFGYFWGIWGILYANIFWRILNTAYLFFTFKRLKSPV